MINKVNACGLSQPILKKLAKNHDYFYNHFITGPYLDSISQAFCLIGTVIVLLEIRQRPYLFLFLSYISVVLFIGSTSPDWFSPITRGLFLLPYGFVFTGLGINLGRQSIVDKAHSIAFCFIVLSSIIILNVYQSQISTFSGENADYTGISLIMRSLQQANTTHKPIILLISHNLSINAWLWSLPYMIQAYGLSHTSYTIVTPNNFLCSKSIENSSILVLQQDVDALQKLKNSTCKPPLTYTILSPTISIF